MFLLRTSTAETLFNCTLVRVIPSVKPKVVDKYARKFAPLNTTQASSAGSAYTSNVLSSFAGAPMAGALS